MPVGFLASITAGWPARELTEMAELARPARSASPTTAAVVAAGVMRRALQYQRLCGGVLALHEEDPALSGRRHARGRGLGRAGHGRHPVGVGVDDGRRATRRSPATRTGASTSSTCPRRVGRGGRAPRPHGVRVTAEATPHHLTLTDEAVRSLDTRFKMNPPLRAEDDRHALIDGLRDGTIDCVATDHAPHARARRRRCPSRRRRWASRAFETAFAALDTDLVRPGVLDLELLVERMTVGGSLFDLPVPRVAVDGARQPLPGRPRGRVGGGGARLREPLGELLLRRAHAARPGRGPRLAAGTVAYRERSFAVVS